MNRYYYYYYCRYFYYYYYFDRSQLGFNLDRKVPAKGP